MKTANTAALSDPFDLPRPNARINHRRVTIAAAVIESQRALTYDTFELKVRCDNNGPAINARAGQFASLRFPGIEQPRSYSFALDPRAGDGRSFTFYIRCVPNGAVSAWLMAADRSGTAIEVAAPLGRFARDDISGMMLCIAGGSGMSAVRAVLEEGAREQVPRACRFYYGARTQADLYCIEELAALSARWHPDYPFEFTPVLSEEPAHSDWRGARGFVTDYVLNDLIESAAFDAAATSVFFCGPPPMIAAGTELVLAAGVPSARVFRDVFEDARSPAPVIDNHKCVLCDECLLVKPVEHCIVETSGLDADAGFRAIEPARSSGLYYNLLYINPEACIRCYACVTACPHDAIAATNRPNATLRQQPPPRPYS